MTEEDWHALKQDIKIVYNTDNYFWDLKESEILAEKIKMLSIVEPYVGKYFSTEFIKKRILRQTEEEVLQIDKEMQKDIQRMQQEQLAQMAQQQAVSQETEEQQ